MANYLNQKRMIDFDQFDPVKNLWRNVLVVSLEDAIKTKSKILKFSSFYRDKRSEDIEYVTEPNQDFARVCEYAGLNYHMIRKNVTNLLNQMEDNYGKKNMPKLPWKRLYQAETAKF